MSRQASGATARRPSPAAAFTLLEVMVSLAILAAALVGIVQASTLAAASSGHARMLTTATLLARQKMLEIEDELQKNGFSESLETEDGDFGEQGHDEFRWQAAVEKVELPEGIGQQAAQAAEQLKAAAGSGGGQGLPAAAGIPPELAARLGKQEDIAGMFASAFSAFVDQVRQALQDSIRRVKLTVSWNERGAPRSFDVVAYFTDPRKIDAVMGLGVPAAVAPQPGMPAAPGPGAGAGTGKKP